MNGIARASSPASYPEASRVGYEARNSALTASASDGDATRTTNFSPEPIIGFVAIAGASVGQGIMSLDRVGSVLSGLLAEMCHEGPLWVDRGCSEEPLRVPGPSRSGWIQRPGPAL